MLPNKVVSVLVLPVCLRAELLEAEGKEPADSRRGEAQEHKAGFGAEHWATRRLEPQGEGAVGDLFVGHKMASG